jgi:hypothetical protein
MKIINFKISKNILRLEYPKIKGEFLKLSLF